MTCDHVMDFWNRFLYHSGVSHCGEISDVMRDQLIEDPLYLFKIWIGVKVTLKCHDLYFSHFRVNLHTPSCKFQSCLFIMHYYNFRKDDDLCSSLLALQNVLCPRDKQESLLTRAVTRFVLFCFWQISQARRRWSYKRTETKTTLQLVSSLGRPSVRWWWRRCCFGKIWNGSAIMCISFHCNSESLFASVV